MKIIDFDIPKSEVLRYAGHKSGAVPQGLDRLADEVIALCRSAVNPKSVVGRFAVHITEKGVEIGNTAVLLGEDIKNHLAGCDECYIMCVTAGMGADSFIRTMMAADTVRGMLADAAATAAVENCCDVLENSLRTRLKEENKFLTWRYSPGYGDFPFTQQPEILSFLKADRLAGVTCNESCIMIPSK